MREGGAGVKTLAYLILSVTNSESRLVTDGPNHASAALSLRPPSSLQEGRSCLLYQASVRRLTPVLSPSYMCWARRVEPDARTRRWDVRVSPAAALPAAALPAAALPAAASRLAAVLPAAARAAAALALIGSLLATP